MAYPGRTTLITMRCEYTPVAFKVNTHHLKQAKEISGINFYNKECLLFQIIENKLCKDIFFLTNFSFLSLLIMLSDISLNFQEATAVVQATVSLNA